MDKRKVFVICIIVSILIGLAAVFVPMGTKLCSGLLCVSFFGTLFFGCQFAVSSPVVAEIEGGKKYRHTIQKKKIEINNVWDVITEQNKEKE